MQGPKVCVDNKQTDYVICDEYSDTELVLHSKGSGTKQDSSF